MKPITDANFFDLAKYNPIQYDFNAKQLKEVFSLFHYYRDLVVKHTVKGHSQFCDCYDSFLSLLVLECNDTDLENINKTLEILCLNIETSTSLEILYCPVCRTWTVSDYL